MRIILKEVRGPTKTEVEVDENMTIREAKKMTGQADNPLVS